MSTGLLYISALCVLVTELCLGGSLWLPPVRERRVVGGGVDSTPPSISNTTSPPGAANESSADRVAVEEDVLCVMRIGASSCGSAKAGAGEPEPRREGDEAARATCFESASTSRVRCMGDGAVKGVGSRLELSCILLVVVLFGPSAAAPDLVRRVGGLRSTVVPIVRACLFPEVVGPEVDACEPCLFLGGSCTLRSAGWSRGASVVLEAA